MKTVEQIMNRDFETVGAGRTVAEATALMVEREVNALPVVEGERLVGLVTMRDLIRALPYRTVSEVMSRDIVTGARDMTVIGAYFLMEDQRIGQLPVVENDRIIGLLDREDILRVLGRPADPLTDLPWASALRERAIGLLKTGQEIAIIFLDLDNFGLVNKQFGHVIGDQYIVAAARTLQAIVDDGSDILCRYGGDEFAILTTKPRNEAEALSRHAVAAIERLRLPGTRADFVLTASAGIAGGKRTTERQDIHLAATVDDLITIASRQSTAAKMDKGATAPAVQRVVVEPRLQLRRVSLTSEGAGATASVELGLGSLRYASEVRGPNLGTAPLRSLAEATIQAINRALAGEWIAAVDDVRVIHTSTDNLITVMVLLGKPGARPDHLLGSSLEQHDPAVATVKATLKAVNRRIGYILR